MTRDKTQKQFAGKTINSLFDGTSTQLEMLALENQKGNKEELDEIQHFFDKLKNNNICNTLLNQLF